ncbi:hypothetical protein E4659_08865 [Dickeya dianthicola]|nr:hypothetical protein [Dickeya dianthicola]MBT1431696.1 hypothetical protein [Dickeya dianthicola]MBT1459141.1 hypothetical protein [Dickeya dianthicola]MZG21389.1 hypothetical protein [Dickeya dianthicola]UOO21458.1 hypothetical protein E4659_08865 [Dickeya dianthicola]
MGMYRPARLWQIASVGSQGHRVAKAIDWLKMNDTATLRIEELAFGAPPKRDIDGLRRKADPEGGNAQPGEPKTGRNNQGRTVSLSDSSALLFRSFDVCFRNHDDE